LIIGVVKDTDDQTVAAGALATGLVQEAWVLTEVSVRVGEVQTALNWNSFVANARGLFLWEAFVAGAAKKATHIENLSVWQ
jgi:hypothetical protein